MHDQGKVWEYKCDFKSPKGVACLRMGKEGREGGSDGREESSVKLRDRDIGMGDGYRDAMHMDWKLGEGREERWTFRDIFVFVSVFVLGNDVRIENRE